MSTIDTVPWERLERASATLFVAAAVMTTGAGVQKVLTTTAGIELPSVLLNLVGQGGVVLSLVGVLGLYSTLADRSPKLAATSAISAAVGGVSFAVALVLLVAVVSLNTVAGMGLPRDVIGILFVPGYLGAILAYLSAGVASTRTDAPSRAVGALFLVVVAVPVAQVLGLILFEVSLPRVAGLGVVDVLIPVVLLAVGYLLRSRASPSDRGNPSGDVTAR